jgi:hypothetical protein
MGILHIAVALHKLITQPACFREVIREHLEGDAASFLYKRGQKSGVCTLVLEGRLKASSFAADDAFFQACCRC